MSVEKSNTEFSLQMSRKAPKFLDANGMAKNEDPLAQTWEALAEAFSRLHGQRLVELMSVMLSEMPTKEKVILEWENDERSFFYFRFSNGWSLGEWTENANEPNTQRWEHTSTKVAPTWFPRDKVGLERWKHWHNLLCSYTIDSKVDHLAQDRLEKLSQRLGGLSKKDLPAIEAALVGTEWSSSLEYMELSNTTAKPVAKSAPKRRI